MIEVRAERQTYRDKIDLLVLEKRDGRIAIGDNVTMRTLIEGEYMQPTLSLDNTAAQLLIDELWRCGLRPSEGTGSAGSLAATERHLADMQKIAMGLLKERGV